MKARLPSDVTLEKYGLTKKDFRLRWYLQEGKCAICGIPLEKRFNIDHQHVKGWKKMPPEERKHYVRGILCWQCNHGIVGRGVTAIKLRSALKYLDAFEWKMYLLDCERAAAEKMNKSTSDKPSRPAKKK